jgi:hypothetical protein
MPLLLDFAGLGHVGLHDRARRQLHRLSDAKW